MRVCFALIGVLFLAGCGLFSRDPATTSCPETGYVKHATSLTNAAGKEIFIKKFGGTCRLEKDGKTVSLDLTISFAGAGPVSYFVAALSPTEEILQRQGFTATAPADEAVTIRLPLAAEARPRDYKVLMGLSLTPEQFAYNKEHGK